jgi:hypothetical protein
MSSLASQTRRLRIPIVAAVLAKNLLIFALANVALLGTADFTISHALVEEGMPVFPSSTPRSIPKLRRIVTRSTFDDFVG